MLREVEERATGDCKKAKGCQRNKRNVRRNSWTRKEMNLIFKIRNMQTTLNTNRLRRLYTPTYSDSESRGSGNKGGSKNELHDISICGEKEDWNV
jgi:hypothetical protein